MQIVKKILIGLGVFFLVVIAFFTWLGVSSARFRTQEEPFVTAFVTDLSKRWEIKDVYDRLANPFVEQVSSAQGQQLLHQFKQLGALQSVRDLELRNYVSGTNGKTGSFTFKGTFENGDAVVNLTILKNGSAVRVLSLYLSGTQLRESNRATKAEA
jgi:hypothetical protein